MSDATIIIIFIVSLIVAVGFLILVLTMIPAIHQFRFLLKDLEKTSGEVRELAITLKVMSKKIDQDIDKADEVLNSAKETVDAAKYSLEFINTNIFARSFNFFAILPAVKFGWKLIKKLRRR
jgi:hypothetical protein